MRTRVEDWLYIHYGIDLDLPGYFFMLSLAIALGCWLFLTRTRRERLAERAAYSFLILAIPLLFVGSKLGYWLQYLGSSIKGWDFWLGEGVGLYGGLIAVLLAAVLVAQHYRLSVLPYLDILAVSLSLGLIFGRLGCFLGGCNAGVLTDSVLGVCFPNGSPPFDQQVATGLISEDRRLSLPVHPTQLYESLFSCCLLLLGWWRLPRRRFQGEVFCWLVGTYAIFRFLEEFIRGDSGGIRFGFMTFSQGVSIVIVIVTMILWATLPSLGGVSLPKEEKETG